MTNEEVSRVLEDIADLLELKGENRFKIRAYQRAAYSISFHPKSVQQMVDEGADLRVIPGIGEAIAKKVQELVTTGKLDYYTRLRDEFPPGVTTLLEIPTIGPRTAVKLASELDVQTVEQLEQAIKDGRVAQLFRLGEKSASNILSQIEALRRKDQRIPIGEALPYVDQIVAQIRPMPGVHNLTPAGSLRRFKETIGDIDMMGTADDPEAVLEEFTRLPIVRQVLAKGPAKASVIVPGGLQVDLRFVAHDSFGSLLQYFTGSKQHNIDLRERAVKMGLKISEYGITTRENGRLEKFADEELFYRRLGLQWIPPEIREATGEIERAAQGTIPHLIEQSDILGDLHVHTDWSDGVDTIGDMANAARARGYEYMIISDHSAGRGIAHGLSEERLRSQMAEVKRLNESFGDGFRLLMGTEVDIRADGRLDGPDALLEELDVVVGAVHSAMGQPEGQMTKRVIRALENPHVDILAHPTCRLIGEREPVAIDMEAVFQAARKSGKALEISGMPSRLDLKDLHIARARELGVKLVLDTDAHKTDHLAMVRFGVGMAKRGWCEAKDILNTRPLEEFLEELFKRP